MRGGDRHPVLVEARGFTLVELLAVIVLLSMVAGMATVGLASSGAAAAMHRASGGWRNLDARARVLARAEGPVVVSLGAEGRSVRAHLVATGERFAEVSFGDGIVGRLEIEGEGTDEPVRYDGLGRSADYEAVLTGAHHGRRWRVAGLTGLVTEIRP